MKRQKKFEKSPKSQIPAKETVPTIKYAISIPEDRDPQPKDYNEIDY
ncbi:hypothetical protein RJD24_06760 [Bacillaceae bacterium IKA-2]|nr:hypothetical protein RJD24_06760 [Bacillaceae bacterium IKA-2]